MFNVAVLMSTYNGEKYIREQIESILSQKGVKVSLFIRDDDSKDGTKEILEEYASGNHDIQVEFGENMGVGNSFMNLLYSAPDTFDYYSFADQDDIWEDDKLIEAIKFLQKYGKLLYASNQECVDKFGATIKIRYDLNADIHLSPIAILQENMLAGCTMVFNQEFYNILVDKAHRPSAELLYNRIHDVWLAFVASLYNGLVYDNRSFIKYRQHEENVVGIKPKKGARLKKLKNKKLRNGRSMLAREACEKFPEIASGNQLIVWSAKSRSLKYKIKLIKSKKILCGYSGESGIGLIIKIISGLY